MIGVLVGYDDGRESGGIEAGFGHSARGFFCGKPQID